LREWQEVQELLCNPLSPWKRNHLADGLELGTLKILYEAVIVERFSIHFANLPAIDRHPNNGPIPPLKPALEAPDATLPFEECGTAGTFLRV
jgi:hypothetical protein